MPQERELVRPGGPAVGGAGAERGRGSHEVFGHGDGERRGRKGGQESQGREEESIRGCTYRQGDRLQEEQGQGLEVW